MISVTKISNQDDGFLLSYYYDNQNQSFIVNGSNIIAELNSIFASIKKANDAYKEGQLMFTGQGANSSSIGLGELRMASQKSAD